MHVDSWGTTYPPLHRCQNSCQNKNPSELQYLQLHIEITESRYRCKCNSSSCPQMYKSVRNKYKSSGQCQHFHKVNLVMQNPSCLNQSTSTWVFSLHICSMTFILVQILQRAPLWRNPLKKKIVRDFRFEVTKVLSRVPPPPSPENGN